MEQRVSVSAAVWVGTAWVNIPVLLMLLGPMCAVIFLGKRGVIPENLAWLALVAFALGFVLAWFWWSYSVVRWKLWAYPRVDDLQKLKSRAVAAGLIWPDGHTFERTELRNAADQQRLNELERREGA